MFMFVLDQSLRETTQYTRYCRQDSEGGNLQVRLPLQSSFSHYSRRRARQVRLFSFLKELFQTFFREIVMPLRSFLDRLSPVARFCCCTSNTLSESDLTAVSLLLGHVLLKDKVSALYFSGKAGK
jgi:hypothetical protein